MKKGISTGLDESEWRRLCSTIERGKCILILGPDVATDPDDDEKPPLADQLATSLTACWNNGDATVPDNLDLPLAAELFIQNRAGDRYDLEQHSTDFLNNYRGKSTPMHRDIASLPFRLVLKTTIDGFIETALGDKNGAGKTPVCAYYNFRDPGSQSFSIEDVPEKPLVYGLFGDAAKPESLILSETDILDFLVKVSRGSSTLPSKLVAYLAKPDMAFLFLGFGFHHWYSRLLLHLLKQQRGHTRSIALERETIYRKSDWPQTALFFDRSHAISFCGQSWRDFASTLKQRLGQQVGATSKTELAEVPDNAPRVFLCHDGCDSDEVAELERELRRRGIDTWLDKQQLRGGEQWNSGIRQVIGKVVDYVLVLETPNLVSKADGYVFTEITEAIDRQKAKRPGFSFLIPATLKPCAGLEFLDHLHRIDVTQPQGINQLCDDILADWAKQKAMRQAQAVL